MKVEVNVFSLMKQPGDIESVEELCLIESSMSQIFNITHQKDPLLQCLTNFASDIGETGIISEVNALLDSVPVLET